MATAPLLDALEGALPDRPFTVKLWDGTSLPQTTGEDGPVFTLRSPRALAHVMRAPGQLGVGRAYVAGDLDVDDIDKVFPVLDGWRAPRLDARTKLRIAAAAARAGGLTRLPRVPATELRPEGPLHSLVRDRRAIAYHYDVSNEFFALFLDESMTYSCAIFSRGAETLEEAQRTKLELVCAKLALQPGDRLLDVGCGWGSFAMHAAREHGAQVTGITLSERQAAGARARVREAGLADRVDIRVMDWRELDTEPFDAIASIGMVEHVGETNIDAYATRLAQLLRPGGRLLNHGIARLRPQSSQPGPFSERYVFPDGDPLPLSRIQYALESAGLQTEHIEGFPEDYARTLREWISRLEANAEEAERLAGAERMRVWRVYLRAARNGFDNGFTSVYQVRARLPGGPSRTVRDARTGAPEGERAVTFST